jgi:hypothetical protein
LPAPVAVGTNYVLTNGISAVRRFYLLTP